jgi:hypothetical protein
MKSLSASDTDKRIGRHADKVWNTSSYHQCAGENIDPVPCRLFVAAARDSLRFVSLLLEMATSGTL